MNAAEVKSEKVLKETMKNLSNESKVLLGLCFYEKLSLEQVALVMGLEIGEVVRKLSEIFSDGLSQLAVSENAYPSRK